MVLVKCLIPKHCFMAAINFETSCSPLAVGRYVDIPYERTQLTTDTVVALVDPAIMIGTALVSFVYRSVN